MLTRQVRVAVFALFLAGCDGCEDLCDYDREGVLASRGGIAPTAAGDPEGPGNLTDLLACDDSLRVDVSRASSNPQDGLATLEAVSQPRVRLITQGLFNFPVPNEAVEFDIVAGGGIWADGTTAKKTIQTDSEGYAVAPGWRLGIIPGANRVRVTVPTNQRIGLAVGSPLDFDATGSPRPATAIAIFEGNNQDATVGTPVGTRPAVRLTDATGPIAGASVTFTVKTGGGTVAGATPTPGLTTVDATTDLLGIARVQWTLGRNATQPNALEAAIAGLPPVQFAATAKAGAPITMEKLPGRDSLSADPGTTVAQAPAVKLVDQYGNGVPGTTVTFSVGPEGGTVTGATGPASTQVTTATDAAGTAAVTTWTLGAVAQTYHVRAQATHANPIVNNPIDFTAIARPQFGPPVAMAKFAGDGQPLMVTSVVTTLPAVRVTDAQNRPVPNIVITFEPGVASGTFTGTQATTDANGVATLGGWTLGPVAGTQYVIARPPATSAIAPNQLVFSVAATPAAPSRLAIAFANNGFGVPGAVLQAPVPTVKVSDQFGNGVPGIVVTFSTPTAGSSIATPVVTTGPGGLAAVQGWRLSSTPGTNTLIATVTPPIGTTIVPLFVTFTAQGTQLGTAQR